MKLGIQSLQFLSNPSRPMADQIEDAVVILREANRLGFDWVSASEHWISAPTIWPQPLPLLARIAPEVPDMRLMTQMLVLPLHNPVELAEQVATLDQICRGRLTLGCALGYREVELGAAGCARADRVSRLEEGLSLMKQLWSGDSVTFNGKWWSVQGGQMGFVPYQRPHPPIVMAAQSEAATRRAARVADGVFYGPQMSFEDIAALGRYYLEQCSVNSRAAGIIGAGRSVMLGQSLEDALAKARAYTEKATSMYSGWDMQEQGMAKLHLDQRQTTEWAIAGSAADCVETILRAASEFGLTHITLTPYNLPVDQSARIEYVQRLGEDVVFPVKRALSEA